MLWATRMEVMRFLIVSLFILTLPISVQADLEDSLQNPADPRQRDLAQLVQTIRSLQARDRLPPELADLVSRLDSTSDLLLLRNRLLALLPDVARQNFHRDRRTPLRTNSGFSRQNHNDSTQRSKPASNWGDLLWLDSDTNLAPRTDLWVQTWANDSEQEDDFFEYSADSKGWLLGIDQELTERWLLSVSVGTEASEIDSSIFGRDDVDSQQASVGLTYAKDQHSVGLTWQRTDSETDRLRVLFVPTESGIRRFPLVSDFDTTRNSIQIAYSTYFEPSTTFAITPFVSASYAWLETDDYVERGGDALSLIVETDDEEQILGSLGVTLSWLRIGENWSFAPAITALVEHDFKSEITTTISRFTGTDSRFITTGHDISETRWRGGASLSAIFRDRASLTFAYEAHVRDDYEYDGVILSAQLRVD